MHLTAFQDKIIRRFEALGSARQAELRQAVERACRERGLSYGAGPAPEAPHPLAVTPLVVGPRDARLGVAMARAVFRFHQRVPALYRGGVGGLRRLCPLEPVVEEWLAACGEGASRKLLIRIDTGIGPDGPILYETNSVGLAGVYNHTAGTNVLREVFLPALSLSGGRCLPGPELLGLFRRWLGRRPAAPRAVAFLDAPPFSPGDNEMPLIAKHLAGERWPAVYGRPEEIVISGAGPELAGRTVDRAFRHVAFRFLGRPASRYAGFLSLLRSGRVWPGPAADFDHKGLLECLTSPLFERFLSRADAGALRGRVPWTRVLFERKTQAPDGRRVDLLSFIARARERWVLKPNRGYGGDGIVVGRLATARSWLAALDKAVKHPGAGVVQEWRPTEPRPMLFLRDGRWRLKPCRAVFGIFCAGSVEEGLLTGFHGRISPGAVVNVGQGGALCPVFVEAKGR